MVRVLISDGEGITKNGSRLLKCNPMFSPILSSFVRVPIQNSQLHSTVFYDEIRPLHEQVGGSEKHWSEDRPVQGHTQDSCSNTEDGALGSPNTRGIPLVPVAMPGI